jgi:hypothetical protein
MRPSSARVALPTVAVAKARDKGLSFVSALHLATINDQVAKRHFSQNDPLEECSEPDEAETIRKAGPLSPPATRLAPSPVPRPANPSEGERSIFVRKNDSSAERDCATGQGWLTGFYKD